MDSSSLGTRVPRCLHPSLFPHMVPCDLLWHQGRHRLPALHEDHYDPLSLPTPGQGIAKL